MIQNLTKRVICWRTAIILLAVIAIVACAGAIFYSRLPGLQPPVIDHTCWTQFWQFPNRPNADSTWEITSMRHSIPSLVARAQRIAKNPAKYGALVPDRNALPRSSDGGFDTCVVSAFYDREERVQDRRTHSPEFVAHVRRFLSLQQMPLVIFTDDERIVNLVVKYRSPLHPDSKIHDGTHDPSNERGANSSSTSPSSRTLLIFKKFEEWPMMTPDMIKMWGDTWWTDEHRNDIHYQNYAVRASKSDFVAEAIRLDPFRASWFVYSDISVVRDDALLPLLRGFPFHTPHLMDAGRITMLLVNPQVSEHNMYSYRAHMRPLAVPLREINIATNVMAGDKEAWATLLTTYRSALFDVHVRRKGFVGSDSIIFMLMLLERRLPAERGFKLLDPSGIQKGGSAENRGKPLWHTGVSIDWMLMAAHLAGTVPAIVDPRFEEVPLQLPPGGPTLDPNQF